MAFSYSDKNFTVVGNLCFVHIKTTTKGQKSINIPPALADRMLIDDYTILAASTDVVSTYGADGGGANPAMAEVKNKEIKLYSISDIAYFNFFFPINSNK